MTTPDANPPGADVFTVDAAVSVHPSRRGRGPRRLETFTWTLTHLEAICGEEAILWMTTDGGRRAVLAGTFTATGVTRVDEGPVDEHVDAVSAAMGDTTITLPQVKRALRTARHVIAQRLQDLPPTALAAIQGEEHLADLARVTAAYDLADVDARTVALALFNAGGFTGTPAELTAAATAAATTARHDR